MTLDRKWFVAALLVVLPAAYGGTAMISAPVSAAISEAATDPTGSSTSFTVSDSTQVPGKTLSAGTYTIRVVDHLSDRMIVRVEKKGKLQSTFLALPKSSLARTGQGPISLNAGSKSAMRGFVFPDGTVAEFVYPKAEAVGLAKSNNTTIPAVDPASEGRPDTSKLSKNDMEMVTLWMLTPAPVGPGDSGPGVTAAKYQVAAASSQGGQQVAKTAVPARPRTHPAMAALPHTAGEMPLVLLAGFGSLCAAGWMRRRRTA